jgi:hypothetical protein
MAERESRPNDAILVATVIPCALGLKSASLLAGPPGRFVRGRWFSPTANARRAEPSRAKQIQAKLLGFVWIYSSESGLSNGLGGKK